jgi:hypothetical protein
MEESVLFYVAFKTTTTFKEDVRNSGTSFEVHLLNITSVDLSPFNIDTFIGASCLQRPCIYVYLRGYN